MVLPPPNGVVSNGGVMVFAFIYRPRRYHLGLILYVNR
jgi:hypothetical protein